MEHQWYVLQVFSNYEHKIQRTLTDRIEITGLQSEITDVVVPIEEVVELKGGEKKTTERKFFPGYVLVRMIMNDETWHFVKSIPNVMGFLGGNSEKPTPITDNEAMNILNRVEDSADMPKHKFTFQPGEVVRVVDGPFNDFNGVVEEVDYERSMVKVSVQILGRSTPVQLDFMQIEKT